MANRPDYVKEVIEEKELQEKQYWAVKSFPNQYNWIHQATQNLHAQNKCLREQLKQLVKVNNEPSFAEPLVRRLFNVDELDKVKAAPNATNCCAAQYTDEYDNQDDQTVRRPPYCLTTNCEYGRLARTPLEEACVEKTRYSFAAERKIGRWNENDKNEI